MVLNCLGQNTGNGIALPVIVTHLYEILIGGVADRSGAGWAYPHLPNGYRQNPRFQTKSGQIKGNYPFKIDSMQVYWRNYYHLVWATKNRAPLITADREAILFPHIRGKADALGCTVQAINGVSDHIHLVVSIPPSIAIADFVKQIKGSSTFHLNRQPSRDGLFAWQRGYGVFTLGGQQCPRAIAYVTDQKQHHREQTTIEALEYCNDPPGVETPGYQRKPAEAGS
jgi:putative transposase